VRSIEEIDSDVFVKGIKEMQESRIMEEGPINKPKIDIVPGQTNFNKAVPFRTITFRAVKEEEKNEGNVEGSVEEFNAKSGLIIL